MTRAEAVLLGAVLAVLAGGVVAAVVEQPDGRAAPGAVPGPSPLPGATTSPTPSAAPVPRVADVRTGSFARGSHAVVVTAHVTGTTAASLQDGRREVPLSLVGATASGTVPVDCAGPVPSWALRLTGADGQVTVLPVPSPVAAFAEACAAPLPAGPAPTATPGS